MIKVLNCKKKNYVFQLNLLLEKRRSSARISINIVTKIVSDVKKYKVKALLKYEKRFSNNRQIKPSKEKIRKAIRSLDPKIKKAIDFAYKRILKFHSKQKTKNIDQYNKDIIIELLAINLFKKGENFEITLLFQDNAFITLSTEIIEVTLEDQNKKKND